MKERERERGRFEWKVKHSEAGPVRVCNDQRFGNDEPPRKMNRFPTICAWVYFTPSSQGRCGAAPCLVEIEEHQEQEEGQERRKEKNERKSL